MNRCVPTWHIDGASVPFSPELMSETDRLQPIEKEMQELVWRNGRLATQNFNQKPLRSRNEGVACAAEPGTFTSRPKQDLPESAAYSASLGSTDPRPPPFIQEDEMASWLLHYPVEDTLQYRDLVAPAPAANTLLDWNSVVPAAPGADPVEAPPRQAVHPPRPHVPGTEPQIVNFSLFASRTAGKMNRMMEPIRYETGSCSLYRDRVDVTVANSCKRGAAPQVLPPSHHPSQPARSTSDRHCSALVSAPSPRDRKRKAEEPPEDSDSHSEDAYDQTVSTKTRSSRAKRRNRAAEIHNLSERRRRDRINEKMRALQELIPRCNKSDKASMLDEAIEYLKSLQLQVQMMSMGCGMPQMLYPGLPYPLLPPPMGVGMVPRLRNPVVIPFPPVVSSLAVPSSGAGPALYTNLPTPAGSTEPPIISPILPATVAECQQYLSQFQVPLTGRVPLPSSTSNAKSETPTAATQ